MLAFARLRSLRGDVPFKLCLADPLVDRCAAYACFAFPAFGIATALLNLAIRAAVMANAPFIFLWPLTVHLLRAIVVTHTAPWWSFRFSGQGRQRQEESEYGREEVAHVQVRM